MYAYRVTAERNTILLSIFRSGNGPNSVEITPLAVCGGQPSKYDNDQLFSTGYAYV